VCESVPHAASCFLSSSHLLLRQGKLLHMATRLAACPIAPPHTICPRPQHHICQQYLNQPRDRSAANSPSRDLVRSCWRQFFVGHFISTPSLAYALLYPIARCAVARDVQVGLRVRRSMAGSATPICSGCRRLHRRCGKSWSVFLQVFVQSARLMCEMRRVTCDV
jgi:hypothetical protein